MSLRIITLQSGAQGACFDQMLRVKSELSASLIYFHDALENALCGVLEKTFFLEKNKTLG